MPRRTRVHEGPDAAEFYPPVGFVSWLLGAASLVAAWPLRRARYWVLASLAMIVAEGLFSIASFWPRNIEESLGA